MSFGAVFRLHIFQLAHFIQTFLHGLQAMLSYFLMLIFMTYNVWLCLAIIVGFLCGYFVFGWKHSSVPSLTQEHCM